MKAKDPLKAQRDRLEQFDIKVVPEYVTDATTHVIASKRNTAKGLQALINGKYIVDEGFIDAVVYAATPVELAQEENLSPLEQNFDTAWPNATDYLPPAGKEPTLKPPESYRPALERMNVFQDYSFVFGDEAQFNVLMPVITAGHGKALLFNVVYGETTAEQAVTFMQNSAGDKGFGDFQNATENGGVIMVRWKSNEKWRTWTTDFMKSVSLALGQQSIEQGEFLDAILANNAKQLRRTVDLAGRGDEQVTEPITAGISLTSSLSCDL